MCNKTEWTEKALEFAKSKDKAGKFRVLIIDPPYNNTGCKLTYPVMKDSDWINAIDFDSLMDDGFIFIWVTNNKCLKILNKMNKKGWRECE